MSKTLIQITFPDGSVTKEESETSRVIVLSKQQDGKWKILSSAVSKDELIAALERAKLAALLS